MSRLSLHAILFLLLPLLALAGRSVPAAAAGHGVISGAVEAQAHALTSSFPDLPMAARAAGDQTGGTGAAPVLRGGPGTLAAIRTPRPRRQSLCCEWQQAAPLHRTPLQQSCLPPPSF